MASNKDKKRAVILLPTFNEKENIEGFVAEVLAQEKDIPGWDFQILIVDSHSTDGTMEIIERMSKKNPKVHFHLVGRGLGVGLIEGHQYSLKNLNPDLMIQLDADAQVEANVLPRMIKAYENGYDFIIGSRFVKGGKNLLPASRRLFSWGSSAFCRLVMGPSDIKEFSNSARAFTPELFKKIDLSLVPWQEVSFIVQPAFLNAAVVAGAKYTEVPLVFKNRLEGYSKMKIVNYIYDVVTYAIDARLKKWGIKLPFYKISHRSKTLLKFGVVGFVGTFVDFFFYKIGINMFALAPAVAKGFSTEAGIINNFLLNNSWTFRHRQTTTNVWQRFGIYNLVSLGGLIIAVATIALLHNIFGDGSLPIFGKPIAYNNFYFFATIPPVMTWNFIVNNLVTWRNKDAK